MELLTTLFVEHLQETAIAALIAIGVAILGRILLFVIDKLLIPLTRRTKTKLDDVIIGALKWPVFFVFLVIGLRISLGRLTFLWTEWPDFLANLLYVASVLAGLFLAGNLTLRVLSWYREEVAPKTETTLDDQLVPLLRRVLFGALLIVASLMILSRLGINVSAFLGGLGIGGLALAIAAQSALADVYAGLLLWASRPFTVGDRIGLEPIAAYAVVTDIGLRATQVRTRDFREVTIPNSTLIKTNIVNFTRPSPAYRMETQVAIERGSDIEKAEGAIIKAIADLAEGKLYGPFEPPIGLGKRERGPWAPEWVSVIRWYDTQEGYRSDPRFWHRIPPPEEIEEFSYIDRTGKPRPIPSLDKDIRESYRPQVYFTEIDGSRLILAVRCWISDFADYRQAQNQLNRAIYYALLEAGIRIGRSRSRLIVMQDEPWNVAGQFDVRQLPT